MKMTRKRPLQLALAGLLLVALHAEARAATDPPLQTAFDASVLLHGRDHVALIVDGDETAPALAARSEVEQALRGTGHEVIILPARRTPLPPGRELLRATAEVGAAALVLVQSVPAYGAGAIWVSAYDVDGDRLFAYGGRVLAPVEPLASEAPPDPQVLSMLNGPELYQILGRPDLVARYEHRRSVKQVVRVTGGVLLGIGVIVGLLDLAAVGLESGVQAVTCLPYEPGYGSSMCKDPPQASGIPWLIALGGLGMVVGPSFVATDPLSPAEKRALIDAAVAAPPHGALSLSLAPVVTAGGGEVVLGGRF
jgi:hypothetical protein